jgi:tetratricopeptide (TPR) repeat protein
MELLATYIFYGSTLVMLCLLVLAIIRRVFLYRLERCYKLAMQAKNYPYAVEIMSLALHRTPHMSFYLQNRGRARYEMGDFSGAEEDYTNCLVLNQNASAYLDRAMARMAQDRMAEALVDANHAIACSRFWWRCYFVRARVYFALTHYNVALGDLEQAIEFGAAQHPETRRLASEIRIRLTPNPERQPHEGFS